MRAAFLACVARGTLEADIARLTPGEQRYLLDSWEFNARDDQWPPDGDWLTWLVMGGRGAGKTRAGAEWVRGVALGLPPFAEAPVERIALIGETFADVREVMIEGPSGILRVHGRERRPEWLPARRLLVWDNGVRAQAFSSEDPEGLRGPQFGAAWGDGKGWRTIVASSALAILGVLQTADWTTIVQPQQVGPVMVGIGAVGALLRFFTTTPVGTSSNS